MKNLQIFKFRNIISIDKFPIEFFRLKKLIVLDISKNPIDSLSNKF